MNQFYSQLHTLSALVVPLGLDILLIYNYLWFYKLLTDYFADVKSNKYLHLNKDIQYLGKKLIKANDF